MKRPVLLDLFCGAGGAALGYARAGFRVIGVDIERQRRYPFEFHRADALTYPLDGVQAIHASPPCQAYSQMRHLPWLSGRWHWDSVPPTRERLLQANVPWVIENVQGAPLIDPIRLCGSMFGLQLPDGRPIYRHRLFESPVPLEAPEHLKHSRATVPGYYAGVRIKEFSEGSDIEWMTAAELSQAIPYCYTEYIGRQLIQALG